MLMDVSMLKVENNSKMLNSPILSLWEPGKIYTDGSWCVKLRVRVDRDGQDPTNSRKRAWGGSENIWGISKQKPQSGGERLDRRR